jgi:zinc transport system substrate-binding protein
VLYIKFVVKESNMRITIIIMAALVAVSCGRGSRNGVETGGLTITTSIAPFEYFISEIAGSDFNVNVIVPPGASPATFEPTPSVLRGVASSEAVVLNGYLGYEMAWGDRITGINGDIAILRLADSQDLIYGEAHRHGDHFHYSGVDPHFWTSPASAMKMAADINSFLKSIYPERAGQFDSNYGRLVATINEVSAGLDSLLDDYRGESFMIFHPALTYLARDYGLNQVSVEVDGKEPSPAQMKSFIDTGTEKGIAVIFVQKEFDRRNAEAIAGQIGADVVEIDPLNRNWPETVLSIGEALSRGFDGRRE